MSSVTMTTASRTNVGAGHGRSGSAGGGSYASGGRPPIHSLTPRQIRELAQKEIPSILRNIAPTSSITSARKLGETSLVQEENGDLKGAFYGYSRVTTMLQYISNQPEFKANQATLFPQFEDVFKWTNSNIIPRASTLERRLNDLEARERERESAREAERHQAQATPKLQPPAPAPAASSSASQAGNAEEEDPQLLSVADRKRLLQEKGLVVDAGSAARAARARSGSNARLSGTQSTKPLDVRKKKNSIIAEPASAPAPASDSLSNGLVSIQLSPPTTPSFSSTSFTANSVTQSSFPLSPSHISAPSPSSSASQAQNQFVSLASLGPPSPTSSAPDSPGPVLKSLAAAIRAPSPEFEILRRSEADQQNQHQQQQHPHHLQQRLSQQYQQQNLPRHLIQTQPHSQHQFNTSASTESHFDSDHHLHSPVSIPSPYNSISSHGFNSIGLNGLSDLHTSASASASASTPATTARSDYSNELFGPSSSSSYSPPSAPNRPSPSHTPHAHTYAIHERIPATGFSVTSDEGADDTDPYGAASVDGDDLDQELDRLAGDFPSLEEWEKKMGQGHLGSFEDDSDAIDLGVRVGQSAARIPDRIWEPEKPAYARMSNGDNRLSYQDEAAQALPEKNKRYSAKQKDQLEMNVDPKFKRLSKESLSRGGEKRSAAPSQREEFDEPGATLSSTRKSGSRRTSAAKPPVPVPAPESATSPTGTHPPPPPLRHKYSLIPEQRPASTPPRPLPPIQPPSPPSLDEGLKELSPREIYTYRAGRKVLFLDIRTREESENTGHVNGEVVVIEPTWGKADLTSERLRSSVELCSSRERMFFDNRRSFSLVVIYESGESSPHGKAVGKALWEMEFRAEWRLKNAPVLMKGGFKAWREEVGEDGVAYGRIGGSRASSAKRRGSTSSSGASGKISRQNTGTGGEKERPQKLSPTSTANGWAMLGKPSSASTSASMASSPTSIVSNIPPPSTTTTSTPPTLPPSTAPRVTPQPQASHTNSPQHMPSQAEYASTSNYMQTTYRPQSLTSPPPPTSAAPNYGQAPPQPQEQFWKYTGNEKPAPPRSLPETPPQTIENGDVVRSLPQKPVTRKPALNRPISATHLPSSYQTWQPQPENQSTNPSGPSYRPPSGPITYPDPPLRMQASQHFPIGSSSSQQLSMGMNSVVSPPPQASINPSPLARRRSDFLDNSPSSPSSSRTPIDYPDYGIRPPPPVAPTTSERQRPAPQQTTTKPYTTSAPAHTMAVTKPLRPPVPQPRGNPGPFAPEPLRSDYPVMYWSDYQVSTSGLKNLGNTCYMNSTIQCLASVYPFALYFSEGRYRAAINRANKMGSKGEVALAFASLVREMRQGDLPYLSPQSFRKNICTFAPQFSGSDQHDAEEFLNFLLDGLHEDLNRVTNKIHYRPPPEREAELERLPQQIASEQEWRIYRMSNNSVLVDYFQGQFRNRLQCLSCGTTSTTYNAFSDLALPIPTGKNYSRVTIHQCLDSLVSEEIMEKSDSWHCPKCKTLRRASKLLTLSRLPPVLIVVLKRFSFKGPFTDKLETLVEFPIKNLDLTNHMPPPLPPGVKGAPPSKTIRDLLDDPSIQVPPYKYDLFGVTNHYGSLSSGHYTAFINARNGWQYCDDSRIVQAETREIVSKAAYVLYYKRSRPA